MAFLQRVLKVQASVWALFGLLLVLRPAIVVEGLLGLPPDAGTTLLRVFGVTALVVAMLMVLVSQHAAEAWWWAWAFALLEAGVATVCVIHAVFGANESAPALPWWIAGAVSALFCALDLAGLARAEQAKPIA